MRSFGRPAIRSTRSGWLVLALCLGLAAAPPAAAQGAATVRVVADSAGSRLQVDGRDFLVRGMNWDYFPVGQNYAYSLWEQPDDVIRAALEREMSLLKAMGVNVVRQYPGVPPRWVRYIYEQYGIWTALDHPLGRYGTTVNGVFTPQTDYSDPRVRAQLTREVLALVDQYHDTPGLLMWLLGNENNYGLQWRSAATEQLPVGEREAAKARFLYSLVGEVARAVKAHDAAHPVAFVNGDLHYVDLIASEARGIDILGTNMYRGRSFGDAFQVVKEKLGLPILFTEFGADAWNAREMREDQLVQARYLLAQWEEIYANASGQGRMGNAIGGFTFQWSDGWWKDGQDVRLDVHDTRATWANAAYAEDFAPGENNMNEEWWGVVAKGPADARGLFQLYPRAAYYALQRAYALDPYAPGTTSASIRAQFAGIDPTAAVLAARADHAALVGDGLGGVRISGLRLDLATFSTGGDHVTTPPANTPRSGQYPSFRGFDQLQSFYADVTARPSETFAATVSLNVLGHVPDNPIDEIFYENRGRARTVMTDAGPLRLSGNERVALYRASVAWDARDFHLDAFYRTGHYHWGYEGDFFGLYREANYGRAIDVYNGEAPLGMEITGRRRFDGLKLAFGPQLWWGANPTAFVKYGRQVGPLALTGVYQEDLARAGVGGITSSVAVPLPPTRRASLAATTTFGPFGVQVGGLWAGANRVGDAFQLYDGGRVLQDHIKPLDTFGGKAKITTTIGRYSWYAQGAAMGLVADGGPTAVQTFTGWRLGDSGTGDQWNVMTGVSAIFGSFQIAPNFLYQKPIVGPVPIDAPAPGRPRNVLEDPFVVRANREMAAGELLLTWDPTPGTWMYAWDSDLREDARFAASVGYTYRHMPTTMDAAIGLLADGRTPFAFPGATPARDLWEVRGRFVSRVGHDLRLVANLLDGTAEPTGNDPRLLHRYGGDLRLVRGQVMVIGGAKFNDWGPYDYHRDFNLTFPEQYLADVSGVLGAAPWFDVPATRVGVRGTWRSLDRYSPRYCPARVADDAGTLVCDATAPGPRGKEWEIRSYLTVAW